MNQNPARGRGRQDFGPSPLAINIEGTTRANPYFRRTLWTGRYLQATLMSIAVNSDIGLEMHSNHDQFIRVSSGYGLVKMGKSRDRLDYQKKVDPNYAIFIPAGTWHNLINIGSRPLKLYSIYAPPEHRHGTVHETRKIADEAEDH